MNHIICVKVWLCLRNLCYESLNVCFVDNENTICLLNNKVWFVLFCKWLIRAESKRSYLFFVLQSKKVIETTALSEKNGVNWTTLSTNKPDHPFTMENKNETNHVKCNTNAEKQYPPHVSDLIDLLFNRYRRIYAIRESNTRNTCST